MALALFGPLIASLTKGSALGAVAGSAGKALLGGKQGKRRRRARLTSRDIGELAHIKSILGKTAAGNALPFYIRR